MTRHPDQVRAPLWGVIAFVIGTALTATVWLLARHVAHNEIELETRVLAGQVGERIRSCARTRIEMISQVRREWELGGIRDDVAFSSRMEALFTTFPGYQAVNRMNDGVITFVHPLEPNRPALGRRIADTPSAHTEYQRAVADGTPRVTPPIQLFQAGTGFAVYVPTAKGGQPMVLNGVFRIDPLIRACLGADDVEAYAISISDAGAHVFTRPVVAEVHERAAITTLPLFNRTWTLRMAPAQERVDAALQPLDMIWFSGLPLSATIGMLVLALLKMRNRTRERDRRVQARLQQVERMEALGQLAASVAHDFNNLLTIVHASTYVIKENAGSEEVTVAAKDIDEAANRGAALSRELVTFARGDSSPATKVDLGARVAVMKSMLARLVGAEIKLDVRTPSRPAFVHGAVVPLEQVIVNLVVNAKAAMPSGGLLIVEVAESAGVITLRVADTGVGIDPAVVPRIFEPFFSTKAPGEGSGLGLATVYGHVQRMKGEIKVDSKLGVGTEFVLTFPVAT